MRAGGRAGFLALASVLLISWPGASHGESFNVLAEGERWKPAHRYVARGDRVVWKNPTKRIHDVTARGSNWSKKVTLDPGERTAKRFPERGRYRYRCVRHSAIVDGRCEGMCGVIHVRKP